MNNSNSKISESGLAGLASPGMKVIQSYFWNESKPYLFISKEGDIGFNKKITKYFNELEELKCDKVFKDSSLALKEIFEIQTESKDDKHEFEPTTDLFKDEFKEKFPKLFTTCVAFVKNDSQEIIGCSIKFNLIKFKKKYYRDSSLFDTILENSGLAIAIIDRDNFHVEKMNDFAAQALGKSLVDVLDKPLFEAVPELKTQGFEEMFIQSFENKERFVAVERPVDINLDGEYTKRYLTFTFNPLVDKKGRVHSVLALGIDVSDHVKARNEISESQQKLHAIVQDAPFPIGVYLGEEMIIDLANQSLLDILGKGNDILGKSYKEILPELGSQQIFEQLHQVYITGETFSATNQKVDLEYDGIMVSKYFSYHFTPLKDENDKVFGIMNTASEVTDLIVALQTLERTEQRLRMATEVAEIACWEYLSDSLEMECDANMKRIFGYEPDHVLMNSEIQNQIHPDDYESVIKAHEDSKATGFFAFETRIIQASGEIRWVFSTGKVILNVSGDFEKIVGITQDITEEKIQRQITIESARKFKSMSDILPQLIWTADPEGKINYANKSFQKYLGKNKSSLIAESWEDWIHTADLEQTLKEWKRTLQNKNHFNIEHRIKNVEGNYRWHITRAIPELDVFDNVREWVGSSTDIHTQKTFTTVLENEVADRTSELEIKNSELEQKNQALQSFAYISSHDLQEPLRKIQTFSALVLDKEYQNLSPSGQDYIHRISKSVIRMQVLIDDLLSYSRTISQPELFEMTVTQDIINNVLEDLQIAIQEKKAEILIDANCIAEMIPFQISQIFQNLISNSLKFARINVDPVIEINCCIKKSKEINFIKTPSYSQYLYVSYKDNGIGFESQYASKIFELFQQLNSKEAYKGTGIGLSIVKKIVEIHGGEIQVQSEPNKGVHFQFYFPVNRIS